MKWEYLNTSVELFNGLGLAFAIEDAEIKDVYFRSFWICFSIL
jgi:hypothetical protein